MQRLMLVDDEPNVLNALQRMLARAFRNEAVAIETFDDPRQALARAGETRFDLVLSDFRMPAMDGVVFLKAFRQIQPDTVRLVLSASTDFDSLMSAINEAEIQKYLLKPWDEDEVVSVVRDGLARRRKQMEERLLADEMRFQQGELSREALELERLEVQEPGITQVTWGADGSVILDDKL